MLPLISICFSEPLLKTSSCNGFVLLQAKRSWVLLEVLQEQSLHKQVKTWEFDQVSERKKSQKEDRLLSPTQYVREFSWIFF